MNGRSNPTRVYLDHASTVPLLPGVFDAMRPYFEEQHADPSRMHTEARLARAAIEDARAQVAALVDARPREVVFTSSGTEAINYAHHWARGHVVTTSVEHSAVRESIAAASNDITVVGVDRLGRVDPAEIAAAIRPDTVLVSVQLANHEVGTVQSLEFARRTGVLLHVDACAAVGHRSVSFRNLGADLMSISAHKFGGPKGAGALLVRRGVRIRSLVVGGAQERTRRAGLENVPAIIGFGYAAAAIDVPTSATNNRMLTERIARGIQSIPRTERFGDSTVQGSLPHVVCFGVEGVEAEPIVLALDQAGIAVHSGSSCSSETFEPSPVLQAMGVDAQHSLRVSVGWNTTADDVDRFVAALPPIVDRFRAMR